MKEFIDLVIGETNNNKRCEISNVVEYRLELSFLGKAWEFHLWPLFGTHKFSSVQLTPTYILLRKFNVVSFLELHVHVGTELVLKREYDGHVHM